MMLIRYLIDSTVSVPLVFIRFNALLCKKRLTYRVVILVLLSNIPRDKFLNSLLDKNLSKICISVLAGKICFFFIYYFQLKENC